MLICIWAKTILWKSRYPSIEHKGQQAINLNIEFRRDVGGVATVLGNLNNRDRFKLL